MRNFGAAFYTQLLDRLRETPGVTSAAAVLLRPLEGTIGWDVSYEFEFEAGGKDNRVLPKTNYEVVTPDYFKTVGTPLLEGRDFNAHDSEDGEPVAIISQSLAERIRAAGQSPLGSRLRLGLSASALEQGDRCLRRRPLPEHHAKRRGYLRALICRHRNRPIMW